MRVKILGNNVSDNGLLPENAKPLPEPMWLQIIGINSFLQVYRKHTIYIDFWWIWWWTIRLKITSSCQWSVINLTICQWFCHFKFPCCQFIHTNHSIEIPVFTCKQNHTEIGRPFTLKFMTCTIEVWEWISNLISHFTGHVITYPCWD